MNYVVVWLSSMILFLNLQDKISFVYPKIDSNRFQTEMQNKKGKLCENILRMVLSSSTKATSPSNPLKKCEPSMQLASLACYLETEERHESIKHRCIFFLEFSFFVKNKPYFNDMYFFDMKQNLSRINGVKKCLSFKCFTKTFYIKEYYFFFL